MKHTAINTAKFKRLVRAIRPLCGPSCILTPEAVCVGILERLWHSTIHNALPGNIGKLTDEDIAEEVGWLGEPPELVRALVNAGWLDDCETHRLVVHDWHIHAPDFVRGCLKRWGQDFAIADCPEHIPKHTPIGDSYSNMLPNLTEPNLTGRTDRTGQTEEHRPSVTVRPLNLADCWEDARLIAGRIRETCQRGGKLNDSNRVLALQWAGFELAYPELTDSLSKERATLQEKMQRDPPRRPWGWIKSALIRVCKAHDLSFDDAVNAIKIPPPAQEQRDDT